MIASPSILDQRGQILPIRLEPGPTSSAVSSVLHAGRTLLDISDSSATENVPVKSGGVQGLANVSDA